MHGQNNIEFLYTRSKVVTQQFFQNSCFPNVALFFSFTKEYINEVTHFVSVVCKW